MNIKLVKKLVSNKKIAPGIYTSVVQKLSALKKTFEHLLYTF